MLPGLEMLVQQCAPQVAPQTMLAVVHTESKGNPWALNVNGPRRLVRQPASRAEAESWAQWLIARGHSVDIGLAQVNSRHMARFGVTAAQLLDPCTNLAAGARILQEFFGSARLRFGATPAALHAALSAYNTGDFQRGLANGYVNRVYRSATRPPMTPAQARNTAANAQTARPVSMAQPAQPESIFARPEPVSSGQPQYLVYGTGSGIAGSTWVTQANPR